MLGSCWAKPFVLLMCVSSSPANSKFTVHSLKPSVHVSWLMPLRTSSSVFASLLCHGIHTDTTVRTFIYIYRIAKAHFTAAHSDHSERNPRKLNIIPLYLPAIADLKPANFRQVSALSTREVPLWNGTRLPTRLQVRAMTRTALESWVPALVPDILWHL